MNTHFHACLVLFLSPIVFAACDSEADSFELDVEALDDDLEDPFAGERVSVIDGELVFELPSSSDPAGSMGVDAADTAEQNLESVAYWGTFSSECVAGSRRKYSAILWDIPGGTSWEDACWATPANLPNGDVGVSPDYCVNAWFNMWGEFYVDDANCPWEQCWGFPEVCIIP